MDESIARLGVNFLVAYLLGSFPTGYLVGKVIKNVDLRRVGSGNIGATNVFRTVGPLAGIVVLICDVGKGFISMQLPYLFGTINSGVRTHQLSDLILVLTGLSAIAGHNWTVFLRFRGGKGVATGCGVCLGIMPQPTLFSIFLFVLTVALTRYVSLGSIVGVSSFPLSCFLVGEPLVFKVFAVVSALVVVFRHRSNMKRLLAGTEDKIKIRLKFL